MFSLNSLTAQLNDLVLASKFYWKISAYILIVLWAIQIINFVLAYQLNIFGIRPRNIFGLPGIVLSPFLHGSFEHLILNSIPLLILSNLILIQFGIQNFILISIFITIASGIGIWLFGRNGIHVGASAVIMGYWSFLLVQAYFHPNITAILVGLVCLYYLGSLWTNVFPSAKRDVSWEGHLCGFIAGIACAYLLAENLLPLSY